MLTHAMVTRACEWHVSNTEQRHAPRNATIGGRQSCARSPSGHTASRQSTATGRTRPSTCRSVSRTDS
jgi:hypothetical protein